MQVNKTTNNYQPSFQKLQYEKKLKETALDVLKKRVPENKLDSFIKILEESPIDITIGFADSWGDRLDAIISTSKLKLHKKSKSAGKKASSFSYITENRLPNLFNLKPYKFMKQVLMEVRSMEELFKPNKY